MSRLLWTIGVPSREIYSTLGQIFNEVFGEESPEPRSEMVADDVDGWDSLNHVRLIIAVESRFSVRFSTLEIVGLKSVGDMVELISAKLV